MKNPFTATAKKRPGRKSYSIDFRHPLKMDGGRPGKKTSKGLGTEDPEEARELEEELNGLLQRDDLHSIGSRAEAAKLFSPVIVDLFYGDLDPTLTGHRAFRDSICPLPPMPAWIRSLILGNSGVGKSTLLRRFIGCNAETDRFPATSTNRTTTCEIEIVTGMPAYSAAVSFLTRHQAQQEIIEALLCAVTKAIEGGTDEAVMKDLLDDPDQRFRLKYSIGGWNPPKAAVGGSLSFGARSKSTGELAPSKNSPLLTALLSAIRELAAAATQEVEAVLGKLENLSPEDREYALDEMQRAAEAAEGFQDLVAEIMEEIETLFATLTEGKLIKSPSGWPDGWTISLALRERARFLGALRQFSSNTKDEWGRLLTPLVTGIRACGDFRPEWVPQDEAYQHVFIDTQGLDHEKPTTELSHETTSLFSQVSNILFTESGKDSLKSHSARKVMEAIASSGHISKLMVGLTHMDLVVGEDIPNAEDRIAKAFSGLRSLVENEVSRNVSREVARQLATHMEDSTFYLAYLDPKKYPEDWDADTSAEFDESIGVELWDVTEKLRFRGNPQLLQPSVPVYSFESLGLAVREASVSFHDVWDARMSYKRLEGTPPAAWQSIKAMARRHADGWFESFWLRPVDTLIHFTRRILSSFLESPLGWEPEGKKLSAQEKSAIIDRLKQIVSDDLTELSKSRLWKIPQTQWQKAYEPSGSGSTSIRRQLVHQLLLRQVPVPQSVSDRDAQAWVDEVKGVLTRALDQLKKEANPDQEDV